MEKASKVMYTIANIFTWILVILSIIGIVFAVLGMVGVIAMEGDFAALAGIGVIVYLAIILIVALITIAMVRRAKANGSSKGWDVLFMILGIIGGNIFYFLGGLFGLIAHR